MKACEALDSHDVEPRKHGCLHRRGDVSCTSLHDVAAVVWRACLRGVSYALEVVEGEMEETESGLGQNIPRVSRGAGGASAACEVAVFGDMFEFLVWVSRLCTRLVFVFGGWLARDTEVEG